MKGPRLWVRLSLGYFVLLALFVAWFSAALQFQWINATQGGQIGALSLIAFLALGLPLTAKLARIAYPSQPAWVFVLLYTGLAFLKGLGAWVLLGILTYSAHKKIQKGNAHGL